MEVIEHSITVDQPAYTGEPIWVHIQPAGKIHYPFRTGIADIGCNRLELTHDGQPVSQRKLEIWGNPSGILCGWVAPPHSLTDRLPLHVLFPSLHPGKYAVRWVTQTPEFSSGRMQLVDSVSSEWAQFTVRSASENQRRTWLHDLVNSVPTDAGILASDYIPDLVAAAPNDEALRAIAEQLYSRNQVVAQLAASALDVFPQHQVDKVLAALMHSNGPSDVLARLVCSDSLRGHRSQFIADSIRFLDSHDPQRLAAAIETLIFLVHTPNAAASATDLTTADAAILRAAPAVISSGNDEATRKIALYLGLLKGTEAHDRLWEIVSKKGPAAEQARLAIAWNPTAGDLPKLASMLLTSGDPDPSGRDLSSLPNSLVQAFGSDAIPWLEKAVTDSPYVWVRTQSAEELARRNNPAAFRFLLDSVENHRFYGPEMIRFLKDTFPSDLPKDADDAQVSQFLRGRLGPSN
jgi:hypothetical protein